MHFFGRDIETFTSHERLHLRSCHLGDRQSPRVLHIYQVSVKDRVGFTKALEKEKKSYAFFYVKNFFQKTAFFNLLLEVLIRLKRSWCHWKAFAKSNQMLHLTCSKCISFEKYLRKTAVRILLSAPVCLLSGPEKHEIRQTSQRYM